MKLLGTIVIEIFSEFLLMIFVFGEFQTFPRLESNGLLDELLWGNAALHKLVTRCGSFRLFAFCCHLDVFIHIDGLWRRIVP